jgi:hypothetical protein
METLTNKLRDYGCTRQSGGYSTNYALTFGLLSIHHTET